MKCQQCNEAEATVHLKEVTDGKLRELHMCESCANEKGLHLVVEQNKMTIASQFIWMAENLYPETSTKVGAVQCSSCGLRFSQFSRVGRVGCPDCYDAFQPQLQKILLRVHGATRHKGRVPAVTAAGADDIATATTSTEAEGPDSSGTESSPDPGATGELGDDVAGADAASGIEAGQSMTRSLEAKLRQAIETENYEEAARLRDQIRKLEGGGQ